MAEPLRINVAAVLQREDFHVRRAMTAALRTVAPPEAAVDPDELAREFLRQLEREQPTVEIYEHDRG